MKRVVGDSDLVQMYRHADAAALPRGDLISFASADLVLEVSDEEDNRQFIAVEISYTADRRDSDRAGPAQRELHHPFHRAARTRCHH